VPEPTAFLESGSSYQISATLKGYLFSPAGHGKTRRTYVFDPAAEKTVDTLPTHLLYGSIAYPITEKALTIGREIGSEKTRVQIYSRTPRISPPYCTIRLRGRKVELNDYSTDGIFVDEIRVEGSWALKLGQTIRLGTNAEQLQLIACLNRDET